MKLTAILEEGEGKKLADCDEKGSLIENLREDYRKKAATMPFKQKAKARMSLLATEQTLGRANLDKYTGKRMMDGDTMNLEVNIDLLIKAARIKNFGIGAGVENQMRFGFVEKTKKELDSMGVKYKSVYLTTDSPKTPDISPDAQTPSPEQPIQSEEKQESQQQTATENRFQE